MKRSLSFAALLMVTLTARAQTTLSVTASDALPTHYPRIVPDVRDGMRPLLEDKSTSSLLLGDARQFNATIFRSSLVVLVNVPMTVKPPCPLANSLLLDVVDLDSLNQKYETSTVTAAVKKVPWRAGCLAANVNYGSALKQRVRVVANRLLLEADYALVRQRRYALHVGSAPTISVRALEPSYDRGNPGTYLGPLHGTAFASDDWARIRSGTLKLTIEGLAAGFISQGGGR